MQILNNKNVHGFGGEIEKNKKFKKENLRSKKRNWQNKQKQK